MSDVKKEKKTKKATKAEVKKETKVKATVKKEKKETKKETALLNKKDQKRYHVINKIIRILAKIARVCLMIFVPFVILSMFFIPIIFKNYEISGNVIKFDETSIIVRDNGLTFKFGDNIQVFDCNTTAIDNLTTYLSEHSKGAIIFTLEFSLLLLGIIAVLDIYIFGYVEKLFGNFEKEKTPFTEENADYILSIVKLVVAAKVVYIIMAIFGLFSEGIGSVNVFEILIIIVAYFIFKYAADVQKKVDTKIYD